MKKLLFAILLFAPGLAHAEKRFMIMASTNGIPLPQLKEWVSEAIYYSSATCSASSLANVIVSTTPAYLFAIHIASAGLTVPYVEVFDGSVSTTGARRVSAYIDATKTGNYIFNVALSSGLAVSIQGGVAPCVNSIYSER